MADYAFVTHWSFEAPIESVWELISKSENWPGWWPGVEKVELLQKGLDGGEVGSLRRLTWKSKLPYKLSFEMRTTRIGRPRVLEGRAIGELEGTGRWELRQEGAWTKVCYDWRVATTKPWMNFLAPVARPLFGWNHDVVMGWGGEGLARKLGCEWRNGKD